ncbi:transcription antitermination factor NusB [Nitrosomonas ureae]|uniref:Transcription antitermination protein NusB n=1 Tax=Nitrosomonas ureae TaxID=44577 RepID=A0A1H5RXA2_9PROT|nr:transcription antitermination factor NusB [Nitrosomonas ureae]SEF42141.1 NusB antitermination factor [Nitrosomonas ureae]
MISTLPDANSPTEKKTEKYKSRRRIAREFVLQGIYQWRTVGGTTSFIEQQLRESGEFRHVDEKHFTHVLQGALQHVDELEKIIRPCLDRSLDELSPVEFAILLLSTFELIHHPEIPYRAILNEAIELARTYGGSDGHKYVNGVLDKLAIQLRSSEIQMQKAIKNRV